MPDEKLKQLYLVTVSRMSTSDDADLVSKWTALVAEENMDKPLLPLAAEVTTLTIKGCPLDNIRPMTEAEIDVWRKAENETEVEGPAQPSCFETRPNE
jgi:hypothetical protein